MIGLLRTIAALEILSSALVVALTIHGLGILLPRIPDGALLLALVGATFATAAAFAGVQLWLLRERGRVASVIFLIVLILFSAFELVFRGHFYVIVRLILEGAALVVLLSSGARDVCGARPLSDPGGPSA